jgi:hypothetical protein
MKGSTAPPQSICPSAGQSVPLREREQRLPVAFPLEERGEQREELLLGGVVELGHGGGLVPRL